MTQRAISLPFEFSSNGSIGFTEDERKIWQDRVVIVVMTYINERVMRPNYGSKARAAAFENIGDAILKVKSEVSRAFSLYLQELTLIEAKPTLDPITGTLEVEILYKYGNIIQPEIVVVKTDTFTRSGDLIREG